MPVMPWSRTLLIMLFGSLPVAVFSYVLQNVLLAAATSAGKLRSSSFAPPTNATSDYVIIGGGTAGNAIAARLAENASISVAIVEAGGFIEENGNGSVVPVLCYNQYTGTVPEENKQPKIDWDYATVPQKVCDRQWSLLRRCLPSGGCCWPPDPLSTR